jgi:hypothetical protein
MSDSYCFPWADKGLHSSDTLVHMGVLEEVGESEYFIVFSVTVQLLK